MLSYRKIQKHFLPYTLFYMSLPSGCSCNISQQNSNSRFFFPQGSVSTLNKLLNTVMGFITSKAIRLPVIGKPGI